MKSSDTICRKKQDLQSCRTRLMHLIREASARATRRNIGRPGHGDYLRRQSVRSDLRSLNTKYWISFSNFSLRALKALALVSALALAACKDAPLPRVYKTLDDYLTHPNPCMANTAKHIKASGRPWPNEEYPETSYPSKIKIFDLWAGDHLYRIDGREINIFHYGGIKTEDQPPIYYTVLKDSLERGFGREWMKERGLPEGADVFGQVSCKHYFSNPEEEIDFFFGLEGYGESVHRYVNSSPTSKVKIGVQEWEAERGEDGKAHHLGYVYAFDEPAVQEVYGRRIEKRARCDTRLAERSHRSPRCTIRVWLGPGVILTLEMEPPAPEHIGEYHNMIVKYFESKRIK